MAKFTAEDYEARYRLFDRFALTDQRNYYARTIKKHKVALSQVNVLRATFALITAIASALAGLLIATYFTDGRPCFDGTAEGISCGGIQFFISLLVVLSVAMPVLGGFFTSLADLYQWDRLISIYDAAVENLEVADSRSPLPDMNSIEYRASLRAFSEGTLQVMSDETAQWGQSIRTPRSIEEFIEEERKKVENIGGDADSSRDTE